MSIIRRLSDARQRWGGYGRCVSRLTDCRHKETMVHYGCGGYLFVVHGWYKSINCGKCQCEDVRAVAIVPARHAQDLNPF